MAVLISLISPDFSLGENLIELMELNLADNIIDRIGLPWVFSDRFLEENFSSLIQSKKELKPKSSIGFRRHFEAIIALHLDQ